MQEILLPGFSGPVLPEWLAVRLRAGLPGVCLYGDNIVSLEQLTELCAAIRAENPRALIALDEEGGDVTRLFYLSGSPYPGAAVLGRLNDVAATASLAAAVAGALRGIGVNFNLAPVVDINREPKNPVIGVRSFGQDPELVAAHGAAFSTALQQSGVAACAKHFPGHGDTKADSHLALPIIDVDRATLSARELVPFRAQIAADVASIMTSHIVVPALDTVPATFSSRIISTLLKEEMGFAGVVITDALDMAGASAETGIPTAAVRALQAGCDLLLTGPAQTEESLAAIESALAQAATEQDLSARLADARARIAQLVAGIEQNQVAVPPASRLPDAASIAGVMSVSERAQQILAQLRESGRGVHWIQIGAEANLAIGHVPWGMKTLEETRDAVDAVTSLAELHAVVGTPKDSEESPLWVGYGRGILRSESAAEIAAEIRAAGGIIVDMAAVTEHPDIDIVSYGASAAVSEALLGMVEDGAWKA